MKRQYINEGKVEAAFLITIELQSFKAITSDVHSVLSSEIKAGIGDPVIKINSHAKNIQAKTLFSKYRSTGDIAYTSYIRINFDYEFEVNIVKRMEKAFMNLKQIAKQNCQGSDEAF